MTTVAERHAGIVGDLVDTREDARRRAISNLAYYNYDRFGYYATRWVTLNNLLKHHGFGLPSPFISLVKAARSELTTDTD